MNELMGNIKLSAEGQQQIKALWEKYKREIKQEEKNFNTSEINKILSGWAIYKDKILNNTFSLDDYTSTKQIAKERKSNTFRGGNVL